MKVSFYVLSASKAQDFLGFICQLTQTALNKSTQSLLILIEDEVLLGALDEALWVHDTSSFMPHERLADANTGTSSSDFLTQNEALAPILLGAYMPSKFNGIVINTTAQPVNNFITATNNALLSRILEIIEPDATSVQAGRDKYKHYQQLGYELTHFKV